MAGWLLLFGPVYLEFATSVWVRPENAHAPFVLAICVGVALVAFAHRAAPSSFYK